MFPSSTYSCYSVRSCSLDSCPSEDRSELSTPSAESSNETFHVLSSAIRQGIEGPMDLNYTASTYPYCGTGSSNLSGIHYSPSGSASQPSTSYAKSSGVRYAVASPMARQCSGCRHYWIRYPTNTIVCQSCMTFFENSLRDGAKYKCTHARRMSPKDCHACRFNRCVRAGINLQALGLPQNVLTRELRGITKGIISDDRLLQRGLVPAASTSGNLQKVDGATSASRAYEKKKAREATTVVGRPGININDNKKKRKTNRIDWSSGAMQEVLDLRDALQLTPLETYREFVKRGIQICYNTVQQRLRLMDILAGKGHVQVSGAKRAYSCMSRREKVRAFSEDGSAQTKWKRPGALVDELRRTKGFTAKETYRELVRRGVRLSYETVRQRLHKLGLESDGRVSDRAQTQPQACPIPNMTDNGSAYLVANAAPPTHLTLPLRRPSEANSPKAGPAGEESPCLTSEVVSLLPARTPTPRANVSVDSEEEFTDEIKGNHTSQQAEQLESSPVPTLMTPHASASVDSEDQLMDELEELIEQAWASEPLEGSRKAPVKSDNESVVFVSDCRTPTEREEENHARLLPPLRIAPASSYGEGPSNRQQHTRKSVQLESPPASLLLTPQTNDFVNNEDEVVDEGSVEQEWSTGPLERSCKASVARNDESVVCVADCHTPTECEDKSRAQLSPQLQRQQTPCYDEVPSNGQPSAHYSSELESPPASVLITPHANGFVDSEDELLNELESIVEKACSTKPSQRNDASPRESEAPVESDDESVVCLSDCTAPTQSKGARPVLPLQYTTTYRSEIVESDSESVVCLSDGPALTQREEIIPDFRLLPPPGPLRFVEKPGSARQVRYQTSQIQSPLVPPVLTTNTNRHLYGEGNQLGEFPGTIQQAWATTPKADHQNASFQSDGGPGTCLLDCPTSTRREGIRSTSPSGLRLLRPPMQRYGEVLSQYPESLCQASQLESSFATTQLNPIIRISAESEDTRMDEHDRIVHQPCSTAAQVKSVDRSLCNQMPARGRRKKWDTDVVREVLHLRKKCKLSDSQARNELLMRGFYVTLAALRNQLRKLDAGHTLESLRRPTPPKKHPRLKKWDTDVLAEVLQLRKSRNMSVAETRRELRKRGFKVGHQCLKNKLQQMDSEEEPATAQRSTVEQKAAVPESGTDDTRLQSLHCSPSVCTQEPLKHNCLPAESSDGTHASADAYMNVDTGSPDNRLLRAAVPESGTDDTRLQSLRYSPSVCTQEPLKHNGLPAESSDRTRASGYAYIGSPENTALSDRRFSIWDVDAVREVLHLRKVRNMTISGTKQELWSRGIQIDDQCLWNKLQQLDAVERPARVRRPRRRQKAMLSKSERTRTRNASILSDSRIPKGHGVALACTQEPRKQSCLPTASSVSEPARAAADSGTSENTLLRLVISLLTVELDRPITPLPTPVSRSRSESDLNDLEKTLLDELSDSEEVTVMDGDPSYDDDGDMPSFSCVCRSPASTQRRDDCGIAASYTSAERETSSTLPASLDCSAQNDLEKALLDELSECDEMSDAGDNSDPEALSVDAGRVEPGGYDHHDASTSMPGTALMRLGEDVANASPNSSSMIERHSLLPVALQWPAEDDLERIILDELSNNGEVSNADNDYDTLSVGSGRASPNSIKHELDDEAYLSTDTTLRIATMWLTGNSGIAPSKSSTVS